jgi:anti-anti-sigma factor
MSNQHKNYKEIDDIVVLCAENYINDVEGENLEKVCDTFLTKETHKFVIDFSGTDIINSIGISILIGIIEKIKDKKGLVLFSGLTKVNHDIFNMVGLSKHIPLLKTEEDAVNRMKTGQ